MDDKKQKILESAFRLFTTRGFHNTPTSLIAKEAGVANGTLFNHFPSKEILINQLYLTCKTSLVAAIDAGLATSSEVKEQIRGIWESSIHWGLTEKEQYLFFQQYSNSPFIQQETRDAGRLQFAPFIDFLEKGMEEGKLKRVPVDLIMSMMFSIIASTIEILLLDREKQKDRIYMESSFSMLWDCIRR